jgi:hypothetical protein
MNVKYIILALLLVIIFSSCSKSLEEINVDPNKISSVDDAYLFSNAVSQTFGGPQNERKLQLFFGAQYSHFYVCPHNTARPHDTYDDFLYTDDYLAVIKSTYTNPLQLSNRVISMTSEGESKNDLRNALAKVLSICNYTRITDLYGEVPYTEGGWGDLGYLYPKYDTQDFIYKSMMDTLGRCVQIIKNGDPEKGYEGFDPMYNNHLDLWAKFANSFRLRLAIRARFAAPEFCEEVIQECLQEELIETNKENARLFSLDDERHYNEWSRTWEIMPWKMSEYLVSWLIDSHDPRLTSWVLPNIDNEYKGVPNGLNDNAFSTVNWNKVSDPAPNLYAANMPVHFLTAAEVKFMQAEAEIIVNGFNANKYYQEGIFLAMSLWKIPQDSINRFINEEPEATLFGDEENMLRQIGTQKWLALITNFTESYTEIRRLGYPVIPRRTDPFLDPGVTDGYLPKRFLYPPEEISLNQKNVEEAIERQGPNKITTPVWWDVRDTDH